MKWILLFLVLVFGGWRAAVFLTNKNDGQLVVDKTDSVASTISTVIPPLPIDSIPADSLKNPGAGVYNGVIDTKNVSATTLVQFAKTLIGVPYLYGSTNPANGFDCSGFITYVFNHFGISVPRSSIDFTNVGREVSVTDARQGDLILFTGTNPAERFVGHMGIVTDNTDSLRFIHSTSGKQHSVTITALGEYYTNRYVKTVRIFP